jgi:hypothetical protein
VSEQRQPPVTAGGEFPGKSKLILDSDSADIVLTSLGSDEAVEAVFAELFTGQEVSRQAVGGHSAEPD